MTEMEWLACTDPQRILWWLRDTRKASDRKLRLFAAAYCRLQWSLLTDVRSQTAVEVAERYADGLATERERERAAAEALTAASEAAEARKRASGVSIPELAAYAATSAWYAVFYDASSAASTTCDADAVDWYAQNGIQMPHSKLLREVFGNPFRPVALDPACQNSRILALAQAIYDERAFDRLPQFAEDLEQSGCTNAEILRHCRQESVHVLGCWVVDVVIEKQ